jgi:hypothetical protein
MLGNRYEYVVGNPVVHKDPTGLGLDIAVIENGPTANLEDSPDVRSVNPFGHTALAITGPVRIFV